MALRNKYVTRGTHTSNRLKLLHLILKMNILEYTILNNNPNIRKEDINH